MALALNPQQFGPEGPLADRAHRRGAVVLRVVVALAVIAGAYHHSLVALFDYLSTDTPLAYVGLVPVLAMALALVKARPRPGELRVPDRQFDWILGVCLLAAALSVAVLLPERLSYTFWTNRIDLLGLPLFAAGVVALLFGTRVLYRVRLPIAFLLLAWPFPYERVVDQVLSLSTDFALWGVERGLPVLGGAQLVRDSVYLVGDGARQFTVNVAPTCAGANSGVGFLLVGGAAVLLLQGGRLRKLAWLFTGVALMLTLNIGRLLALFWAGDRYGEEVMMQSLHPYAGLALFVVGCLVMILLLPWFGISSATRRGPGEPEQGAETGDEPGSAVIVHRPVTRLPSARTALVFVVLLAALLAGKNAELVRFEPFGATKDEVAGRSALGGVQVAGWTATMYEDVTWAKQYFGSTSSWWRYLYESESAGPAGPQRSMFVDVVNVDDVDTFSTYGLEACYRFHGYQIVESGRADVGTAADAQTVTYLNAETDKIWSIVAWVSPVQTGSGRRFERVVLLASVDAVGQWEPKADASTAGLVSFARSFVATAAGAAGATVA